MNFWVLLSNFEYSPGKKKISIGQKVNGQFFRELVVTLIFINPSFIRYLKPFEPVSRDIQVKKCQCSECHKWDKDWSMSNISCYKNPGEI